MNCSRCGAAEAVLKRDAAFYCGKCALARDWEEVIALVQEERVTVASGPTIDFAAAAAAAPAPQVIPEPAPEPAPEPPVAPEPAPAAAAAGPSPNGSSGSSELPADPFA